MSEFPRLRGKQAPPALPPGRLSWTSSERERRRRPRARSAVAMRKSSVGKPRRVSFVLSGHVPGAARDLRNPTKAVARDPESRAGWSSLATLSIFASAYAAALRRRPINKAPSGLAELLTLPKPKTVVGDSINERLTAAPRVAETEPRTLVCREPDHVLRLAGASDSSELRFQLGPNRLTSEDRLGMRPISTAYVAWIGSR